MPLSNITITVNTGLDYRVNDFITVVNSANVNIYGRVVSYNPSTGVLVITPYSQEGSGTFTSWETQMVGKFGSSATAGTSGTSGSSGTSASSQTAGTSGSSASWNKWSLYK